MKTKIRIISIVLVSILLSCQKDELNKDLISTKWYLQAIQDTDTQSKEMVPQNLVGMNIVFSDSSKLHAISSCNTFDGDFIVEVSGSIRISNLGTTYIYCTDSSTRLWESLFFENLKKSSKYTIQDGVLSIQTTNNTIMIFKQ